MTAEGTIRIERQMTRRRKIFSSEMEDVCEGVRILQFIGGEWVSPEVVDVWDAALLAKKGDLLKRGDGSGYEVTRDIWEADLVLYTDLKPFGGAPEPEPGSPVPTWVEDLILKRRQQQPQTPKSG